MAVRWRWTAVAVALGIATSGCGSTDALVHFSAASTASLAAGEPVFRDLGGSCLRARNLAEEIGSFQLHDSDPACDAVAQQAAGAVAAAQTLAQYFAALNALASFGRVGAGKSVGTLSSNASALAGISSDAQQALGQMTTFLASLATGRPQQRPLAADLTQASANVGAVADALTTILERNYVGQELGSEEHQLRTHYAAFASAHPGGEVTLAVDTQWRAEEAELARRRTAAHELTSALKLIKDGTAALAAHPHALEAKQTSALLEPYAAQLQTRTAAIAKVF